MHHIISTDGHFRSTLQIELMPLRMLIRSYDLLFINHQNIYITNNNLLNEEYAAFYSSLFLEGIHSLVYIYENYFKQHRDYFIKNESSSF
jgi:hypothetical protein